MISQGIQINWTDSDEYIEIDLSLLHEMSEITATFEWWRKEKVFVSYSTSSSCEQLDNGMYQVHIIYNKSQNMEIAKNDDLPWGESIIQIKPNSLGKGIALWIDSDNPKNNHKSNWVRIKKPIVSKTIKKNRNLSQIKRNDQNKFRAALIACDKCCVVTGEKTKAALEAAHIIPANKGGNEIINNGILLRADIHRLLDDGVISFNKKGEIVKSNMLSDSYKKLLNGAKISNSAFLRVKEALLELQNIIKA